MWLGVGFWFSSPPPVCSHRRSSGLCSHRKWDIRPADGLEQTDQHSTHRFGAHFGPLFMGWRKKKNIHERTQTHTYQEKVLICQFRTISGTHTHTLPSIGRVVQQQKQLRATLPSTDDKWSPHTVPFYPSPSEGVGVGRLMIGLKLVRTPFGKRFDILIPPSETTSWNRDSTQSIGCV